MHVSMADKAFRLPGVFASETYLDAEKIIDIARSADCDMIHPGYGLLSESSEFSKLCEDNGIKFVGPRPGNARNKRQQARMQEARRILRHTSCRIFTRAAEGSRRSFQVCLRNRFSSASEERVWRWGARHQGSQEQTRSKSAFETSKREAEGSFGKFAVYVEKKLVSPRHLEVQIVASDDSQDVVHLGERECSIQRRYQKLVEISPSQALDDESRKRLWDYATRVAKIVKYSNVGTIEFLRDSAGKFYFLEINSRLQVEHPVSEFVSGIDIVNTQFEIACNNKIPFKQKDIRLSGCAIEFRVNAEDPLTDFSPTTGKVEFIQIPHGPGVRVDTALQEGMTISPYYDSLVAKLITYGENFEAG